MQKIKFTYHFGLYALFMVLAIGISTDARAFWPLLPDTLSKDSSIGLRYPIKDYKYFPFSESYSSTSVASVVSIIPAIEAAFSKATLVTFVGSIMPASIKSP